MTHIEKTSRRLMIALILAVLSSITLFRLTGEASSAERRSGHREFRDSRYHHNRSYPVRGHYMHTLPHNRYEAFHGGSRYYFQGGVWYRPYGSRFMVAAPPFGIVIPFLPPYYTTIWVGGIPYYYANDVYYAQTTGGYMVVEQPNGEIKESVPSGKQLFIYPHKGQTEKQQSDDRYECHRWAVGQTHYDPTQPPAASTEGGLSQTREDYDRAMGACLEGRGYTVK